MGVMVAVPVTITVVLLLSARVSVVSTIGALELTVST
jgi:hypothetical protein